jgi:hypothetical protein
MKHDMKTPLYIQFKTFAKKCKMNDNETEELLHLSKTAYIKGSNASNRTDEVNTLRAENADLKREIEILVEQINGE